MGSEMCIRDSCEDGPVHGVRRRLHDRLDAWAPSLVTSGASLAGSAASPGPSLRRDFEATAADPRKSAGRPGPPCGPRRSAILPLPVLGPRLARRDPVDVSAEGVRKCGEERLARNGRRPCESPGRHDSSSPALRTRSPASVERTRPDSRPVSKVFVSYRHVAPDQGLAQHFVRRLEGAGHRVFWDQQIEVGQRWAEFIEARIREAEALVVLLSAESIRSDMIREEVKRAHRRTGRRRGRRQPERRRAHPGEPEPGGLRALLPGLRHRPRCPAARGHERGLEDDDLAVGHSRGVTPFLRIRLPYWAVSPVITTAKASRERS